MNQQDQKPTVFVIDDEESIRMMAVDMLTDSGYNVISAGDGKEALKIFEQSGDKVDLVLLDMIMPGIDGPEILNRLQKLKPDVKVILSSGIPAKDVPEDMLQSETVQFIEKPYLIEDLLVKISNMIQENTDLH